jgi:tetratricopeptide (TPR) repeat protein
MNKTRAFALIVAVVGSLLYLKTVLLPDGNWEKHQDSGWAAFKEKNYAEAEKQFLDALKEAERFPNDDPRLRLTLNNLAETYRDQAKYSEAEPFYKRVLERDERALGPEHPNVAASLNNLANNYRVLGKYAEAEPLYQRALGIWEKILGPEHPLVVHIQGGYADLLRKTDRVAEAEKLETHKKTIAAKPMTSTSKN